MPPLRDIQIENILDFFLETCFTLANENSINRHIDIPEVYRAAINKIIFIENVLVT